MKFVYILPLLLTGCVTYVPVGDGYANDGCGRTHKDGCKHVQKRCLFLSGFSLVNNTGHLLDVFNNGVLIHKNVQTGQVIPVRPAILMNTTITVVGHTTENEYVGTDSWVYGNSPEVWTVNRLYKPQASH